MSEANRDKLRLPSAVLGELYEAAIRTLGLAVAEGRESATARAMAVNAEVAYLRARVSEDRDTILALRAMIEQAGAPKHDSKFCGTNDCHACEWLAIAKSIGWPLWAEEEVGGGFPVQPAEETQIP